VPLEVWYAEQKRSVLLAGDLAADALSSGEMGPAVREVVGQWWGQGEEEGARSPSVEEMCWEGEPSASEEAMDESEPSSEGDDDSVMDFIAEFELPYGSDEDTVMEDADESDPFSEGEDSDMASFEDEVGGLPAEDDPSDDEAAPLGYRGSSALPPTTGYDSSD
jgi:hypothetical protein